MLNDYIIIISLLRLNLFFDPSYFNDIKNLIDNNDTVYAEHVIEILMRLTDEILASDSDGLLKLVKDYIDDNYNKPISIENVAKQFSYTRTYLSHIFKKQYGFSPKEYLMNKRLSEALNMILQGKKIKVVCNAVGFSNEYNFSRYFKLKYGVSPNNYLRKTKKNTLIGVFLLYIQKFFKVFRKYFFIFFF